MGITIITGIGIFGFILSIILLIIWKILEGEIPNHILWIGSWTTAFGAMTAIIGYILT